MRIDAHLAPEADLLLEAPNSNSAGSDMSADPRVRQAMEHLRHALGSREPERLCTAYQALRRVAPASKVRDLFDLVTQALGPSGMEYVVSAYAHRRCFMCSTGVMLCRQCKGAGRMEGTRLCPNCDGLGFLPCGFCQGSGWADRDLIPHELMKVVSLRHVAQLRRDLKVLERTISTGLSERIPLLPVRKRQELTVWLLRLQARLSALLGAEQVADDALRAEMTAAADQISQAVEAVRTVPPPQEAEGDAPA